MRRMIQLLVLLALCLPLLPITAQAEDAGSGSAQTGSDTAQEHNLNDLPADAAVYYTVGSVSVTHGEGNARSPASDDYTINLLSEKIYIKDGLPAEMQSVFISTNGGGKWTPITIIPAGSNNAGGTDISKILNKGGSFLLASSVTDKKPTAAKAAETDESGNVTSPAVAGANIYNLGTFAKRPGAPKCKINYETYADNTGKTNGTWTLDISVGNLQIAPSNDRKTPLGGTYYTFKSNKGVRIFDCGEKVIKRSYIVRVAPNPETRTPASKIKKLNASSTLKPPKFKVDYKKEIIKTKQGAVYVIGEASENGFLWNTDPLSAPFTKDSAKAGISLVQSEMLYGKNNEVRNEVSYYGETLLLRITATAKKPASAVQAVAVAERKRVFEIDIKPTISAGTFKVPTGMEYYSSEKAKWISSAIKEGGVYLFRFKNKAKYVVKSNATSGEVTSLPIELTLQEGTYGTSDKTGVIDYEVTNFPRYPGLVVGRVQERAKDDEDKEQNRYAYDIYPKDFFEVSPANPYEETVKIDLLGLLDDSSALLDTNEAPFVFALHPDIAPAGEKDDPMEDEKVYINAELKCSLSSDPDDLLEIKSASIDPDSYTLTFVIAKVSDNPAEAFPTDGTTFSLQLSLHETEKDDDAYLSLKDKFYCRPVVFTFKIPSYKLTLKASSRLTYAVSGESKALTKDFDGMEASFKALEITDIPVPTLTVTNQVTGSWLDAGNPATIEFPDSTSKFVVWGGSGNDKMVESTTLSSGLNYFQPEDDGDTYDKDESLYLYFFVKAEDGNLYPFRLVIPTQDDVTASYSGFSIPNNPSYKEGSYNQLTVTLTIGAFKDTTQSGPNPTPLAASQFTVMLKNTSGSSSTTAVTKISKTDDKTVILYLDNTLEVTSEWKYFSLTISKDAFADGITVGGDNVSVNFGVISSSPSLSGQGITKSGETMTLSYKLTDSTIYAFRNISGSKSTNSLMSTYVTLSNTATTPNSISVTASGNSIIIVVEYANMPANTFTLTVKGTAFSPVSVNDVVINDINFPTS